MISSINYNGISFKNNNAKDYQKSEADTKKISSATVKEQSTNDAFAELQSVKEEIARVEDLIADAVINNPNADTCLLYKSLGEMINHQIELESSIRKAISGNLRKNGL